MEKITTYPFTEKNEVIKTSWGAIIAKRLSFEFIFEGVGTIEVFGWLTAEKKGDKILLSGTQFEHPEVALEGELKA